MEETIYRIKKCGLLLHFNPDKRTGSFDFPFEGGKFVYDSKNELIQLSKLHADSRDQAHHWQEQGKDIKDHELVKNFNEIFEETTDFPFPLKSVLDADGINLLDIK